MNGLTDKPCFMCGYPITDAQEIAAVPKAFTHASCATADPGRYTLAAQMIPCCEARATVEVLRGCLIQKREDIPSDELWQWDAEALDKHGVRAGTIVRFEFLSDGRIVKKLPPPVPAVPPTVDDLVTIEDPPPAGARPA